MLEFNPEKFRLTLQQAETDDLLDRVTAYRPAMEPAAIDLIEAELARRGIRPAQIDARAEECRRECLLDATGTALQCSRCRRPAVTEVAGWRRLWRLVPIFPTRVRLCRLHAGDSPS